MIIVEGPDGSGKSTLIKTLGFDYRHLKSLRSGVGDDRGRGWGFPDHTPFYAYHEEIRFATHVEAYGLRRIAFDRFHLSEMVYGPILRNTQLIDESCLTALNALLRKQHIPVILCLPPFDVTYRNVCKEGRERPAYQTDAFLRQAYRMFTAVSPYATQVYDYTRDDLPKVK